MIEKLKNAIFSLSDLEYISFFQNSDSIKFIYYDVVIYGCKDSISVFYDSEEMGVFNKLKFLSKINSLKEFNEITDAFNYMKYLSKVTNDVRYETYHYFIYKMKQAKIKNNNISFDLSGGYSNYSEESLSIRCDISDLNINGFNVKYNFIVTFNRNYKCKLWFYPENPTWNESKECPKTNIDEIIDYILNLKVDNYEGIPLKES